MRYVLDICVHVYTNTHITSYIIIPYDVGYAEDKKLVWGTGSQNTRDH
jgi:hypothetical protein